jgi:translation initiation factor IF-2
VVLESSLDKGRGVTTTVLVQEGILNKGDVILAGEEFGRVRAMFDENGKPTEHAGPSIPVAVIGLSSTPSAGDEVLVVEDERAARDVAQDRRNKKRDKRLASQQQAKLDSLFDQMKPGEVSTLNVLLKADVQGTLEAIRDALVKLAADNEEVKVNIVGSGVGGINETDISLAAASNAIVIGFNVRADASARRAASERGVDLNYYSIIYELIDEVKSALVGMLAPQFREQIIGLAEVKDVFRSQQLGAVAGSIVTEGVVKRNAPIRVLRDNVVIYEGELESLRRFKDDVQEVKSGTECGIAVKNYNDVKVGDQIEVYERVEQERTL